jgi:dCTP deaminase
MLLTYNELLDLIAVGVIENYVENSGNAASIDVHLGDKMLFEPMPGGIVGLSKKETGHMVELRPTHGDGWLIHPGQFVLACTQEMFHMPDDVCAEYKLKSSLARAGLNHSLAGWADAGWNNSVLTMEFQNIRQHSALLLKPGMPIGQMVFWRGEPVPAHASYRNRGQYNGDRTVTPSKGVR